MTFATYLYMVTYVDDSTNYEVTMKNELSKRFTSHSTSPPPVTISNNSIEQVTTATLLGVTLAADLTWEVHVNELHCKESVRLHFLRHMTRHAYLCHQSGQSTTIKQAV